MLSIIAGEFKGTKLIIPPSNTTRPVSQKVRGAIFNILGPKIEGASVLDLYAGSGALGLEALSRGADNVTFVESVPRVVKTIRDNIALCTAENSSKIIKQDAARFIEQKTAKYNCIFYDPPYKDFSKTLLKSTLNLLQLGGVVVVSLSAKAEVATDGEFTILQEKTYSDTKILIVS